MNREGTAVFDLKKDGKKQQVATDSEPYLNIGWILNYFKPSNESGNLFKVWKNEEVRIFQQGAMLKQKFRF